MAPALPPAPCPRHGGGKEARPFATLNWGASAEKPTLGLCLRAPLSWCLCSVGCPAVGFPLPLAEHPCERGRGRAPAAMFPPRCPPQLFAPCWARARGRPGSTRSTCEPCGCPRAGFTALVPAAEGAAVWVWKEQPGGAARCCQQCPGLILSTWGTCGEQQRGLLRDFSSRGP